jgi:hypothetical protein
VSLQPHPEPPSNSAGIRVSVIECSVSLFRTHGVSRNPQAPGIAGVNRFVPPDSSYKVLYLGCDAYCAFIETFGHVPGIRTVTTDVLKNKALTELKPTRPLRLIDLTESSALVRIGADARLFSGAYDISQMWSKAFHDHPVGAQGLLYPSRLDPSRRTIALFGDRSPKLLELNRQSWYAPGPQRLLLVEIMEHYGFKLIENRSVAPRKPVGVQQEFQD